MVVGKAWRYLFGKVKKTVRNYNVVDRAENALQVEKRKISPRHPGTDEKIPDLLKGMSELKTTSEKPKDLLKMLKTIKVSSSDHSPEYSGKSSRSLPERQHTPSRTLFGYEEPKSIPEGKCTLVQALEFISSFQDESKKWTVQQISDKYKLNYVDVKNVTENFKAFVVVFDKKGRHLYTTDMKELGALKIVNVKHNKGTGNSLQDTTMIVDK